MSLRQELAYYIYACLAEGQQKAFFRDIKSTTFDRRHILFSMNKLKLNSSEEKVGTFLFLCRYIFMLSVQTSISAWLERLFVLKEFRAYLSFTLFCLHC